MTDSMNFGPDWIRNLSSEGTTTGSNSGGPKYQLADYRYGREEMLALFDKSLKPPQSLLGFKGLYSEATLLPLALTPNTEEEQRCWQSRPLSLTGPPRGRGGGPLERGGRVSRGGRGGYQNYGRPNQPYDVVGGAGGGGWGNGGGEHTEWSPRKDYNSRGNNDNWRRNRLNDGEDDGWRNLNHTRPTHEKWGRSTSWRGGDGELEDRQGVPDGRMNRTGWNDMNRGNNMRKSWDNDDNHLPEWAMENIDGGGTFDSSGAFHNSDDEQGEFRPTPKKETVLQKSNSQQHISANKGYFSGLQTSKSVASLSKTQPDPSYMTKDKSFDDDKETQSSREKETLEGVRPLQESKIKKEDEVVRKEIHHQQKQQQHAGNDGNSRKNEQPVESNAIDNKKDSRVEDDFKIQEDIILKMVDDDTPKSSRTQNATTTEPATSSGNIQPPPNLGPPMQEQWYYQDPQGQMQGPFTSAEMAEWFKVGYFNSQLKVRRPCDELFYHLGELVTACDGANPFSSGKRFPPLKPDPTTLPEHDLLQYQYLMALKQAQSRAAAAAAAAATIPEPWNALTLQQQQEVAAQRLIMHPQVNQDLQFMHQSNTSNPLMHMINQMQQVNKLPNLADKTPNPIAAGQLDPRLVQLSNLHQLQNRLPPTSAIPNPLGRLPGLTTDGLNIPGVLGGPLGMPQSITPNLAAALNMPPTRQMPTHNVDSLGSKPVDDPISSLLKQLQQQKQQQQQQQSSGLDAMWQTNQFAVPPTAQQWQQQEANAAAAPPLSMWDIAKSTETDTQREKTPPSNVEQQQQQQQEKDKKEDALKELKRKKESEEKQAKKEAEERRKNEQRKMEAERRAAEEKKKKEEERIKREMEKAKRDAEEKRLRELEEKRRVKEQRKAEEEARKKTEEQKKAEEDRAKKEAKEREEYAKREAARLAQEQAARNAKVAPWCQASSAQGLSLQEIQKLEKERARQEAVILQQQKQQMELQQQQQEKAAASFTWANKAKEQRQVKSLAEIQAEEQERLAKQAAEARLLALQKEKEQPPIQNTGNIWNSQNLSWSTNSSTSQWTSTNSAGLWEETPGKPINNKPSTNTKGNTATANRTAQQPNSQQQQQQKTKSKTKRDDTNSSKNAGNNSADEFTNWCSKSLANITSEIDIPTFVTFLRDIESALDVREYCKEYLGDSAQTQQFALNFLEKRRSFRPRSQIQKDDMCSPAPAITPSSIHSNEFQEVKGKNKKNKKNKMLKVDNRILGFNVTSAPDRINVGDRDYGDNS